MHFDIHACALFSFFFTFTNCVSLISWNFCQIIPLFCIQDNGDEFYYTGSGGRDLSGNKRTAEQSCDQKLTRMNR